MKKRLHYFSMWFGEKIKRNKMTTTTIKRTKWLPILHTHITNTFVYQNYSMNSNHYWYIFITAIVGTVDINLQLVFLFYIFFFVFFSVINIVKWILKFNDFLPFSWLRKKLRDFSKWLKKSVSMIVLSSAIFFFWLNSVHRSVWMILLVYVIYWCT